MIISDAHRLLFVHVQKTGGSTIDTRLKDVLPDARENKAVKRHASLASILKAEPELATYWTFGFVRNPWARMLSWYGMVERFRDRADQGGQRAQKALDQHFLGGVARSCPDFESFIMKGVDEFERLRHPQVRYLTTRGRRADLVGRQESLEADLRAVFARFELAWEPPPVLNAAKTTVDYHDVYTEPMRKQVEDVFARDIEVFGYRY